MAVASGIGDGGDLTLAENSEIRVCQHDSTPRPGSVRPRLAQRRCRRTSTAARTCSLATDHAVAETNSIDARSHACRAAGSSREHFQDPGIDPRHDAGQGSDQAFVRTSDAGYRGFRQAGRQTAPPSRSRRGSAGGICRAAARASQRHRRQACVTRPEERPIRSRCRLKKALTLPDRIQHHSWFETACAQFVTILAMQSRMTSARNSRSI